MKNKVVKCELTLKCNLTPEEMAAAAQKMSLAYVKKQQGEALLKTTTAGIKSQIAAADEEVGTQARLLEAGFEHRLVPCETIIHFDSGLVNTFRLDTHECLESRSMTAAERQMELPQPDEQDEIESEAESHGIDMDDDPPQEADEVARVMEKRSCTEEEAIALIKESGPAAEEEG